MTSGEKRFGRRLESLLEDDYLCWFDIPLGKKRRYPDYIVLHPQRGLLFLEIKDWKLSTIKDINHERVVLRTDRGEETTANPLEQARQSAYTVVNQLISDPQLRQSTGKYEGKLVCPYGYGVVLANITRAQLDKAFPLDAQELLLPPHLVICQDEMTDKVEAEPFQEKLWGMFNFDFPQKLTLPQIDRIRWQLFPELRLEHAQTDMFAVPVVEDEADDEAVKQSLPDIVKIMDVQQEQLARSMGSGHRVIHGVAGSGKTLILGFRCLHLAQFSRKPVLVLCFNIALAARLRNFLAEKGIAEKVQVYHFHDWCGEQLKTYHVEVPDESDDNPGQIWERQVSAVIDGVEKEQIPRAQYGALLIDEGHDFEADWLRLVTQMIDPEKDSLLLLYDDAQSIYKTNKGKKKKELDFSLSSVGIQARGRTTVLKLNYRNTRQILDFAYNFSKDFIKEKQTDEDSIPVLAPEQAGLEGIEPVVKVWSSLTEEADFIAHCITTWLAKGVALKDIAVVYTSKAVGDSVEKALSKAKLDHRYLKNSYQKKKYNESENKVTVLTRQSSKGLEFKTVVLAGLGTLKDDEKHHAEEVRLLYVGMTRAREKLLVTSSKGNFYTERLLAV
jgi:hypothetical protein